MKINPQMILQMKRDPEGFVRDMFNSNQTLKNDKDMVNAMELLDKGDSKGLEEMAKSICRSRGVNIDLIQNALIAMGINK